MHGGYWLLNSTEKLIVQNGQQNWYTRIHPILIFLYSASVLGNRQIDILEFFNGNLYKALLFFNKLCFLNKKKTLSLFF